MNRTGLNSRTDGREDAGCRIRFALQRSFGPKRLRDGREEVITRVLAGHDSLTVMPTGAGKSLCCQLPAVLLPGRAVVVSPPIRL